MATLKFSDLKFGEAAAEVEAEKDPDLLLNSFVDRWNVESKIANGDAFLLIGPKGSGKSTVVEYLRLKAERSHGQAFFDLCDVGELYQTAENNLGGLEDFRSEMAWRVFIWLRLYSSLMSDNGSSLSTDPEHVKFFNELKRAGLVSADLKTVIHEVRKKSHKFSLPQNLYSFSVENSGERQIRADKLAEILANAVLEASTISPHCLALDGLDSAFIGSASYWSLLANLLRASNSIHKSLRRAASNIRIVLLCRSDVFLKIQLPDSNKIRQGWGVELDWNFGVDDSRNSYLWDLLERKVEASGGPSGDILSRYFPAEMTYGQNRREEISHYLLKLTRQTPRDILTLFTTIAKNSGTAHPLDTLRIRAGVNKYCSDYFTTEISNEFVGMAPEAICRTLIGTLGRIPRRRFNRTDFESLFSDICAENSFSIDELLQQFFYTGAIANHIPGRVEEYIQFYHRRSHSDLHTSGPFLMHNALTLGLNVKW
ncbi:P-loop ATPase, Sll1717 family [Streptomyces sp. bgisy029]|uniref:P-loop ATPase, Sll1717 family n=1 Tax=Streptomyces sp. bgisy029 TaxID=3413771 RepID=UPI003D72A0B7